MAWHKTFSLPAIITNCSNNYGPFQFPEKLIPTLIIKAIREEQIPIYGNGRQIRDWLYVGDHIKALKLISKKGTVGSSYNIGGNNEVMNIDVANEVCKILDNTMKKKNRTKSSYSELISLVGDRPGHDKRYSIDSSKLSDELGWFPEESFNTGLKKTVSWYLNNKDWWEELMIEKYDGKRIGLL